LVASTSATLSPLGVLAACGWQTSPQPPEKDLYEHVYVSQKGIKVKETRVPTSF